MAKIINGLRGLNVAELIEFAKSLFTKLTGNSNVTIDPGKLTELSANTTTLEDKHQTAMDKKKASQKATKEENKADADLGKTISDIANTVNGSLSDPAQLLSTGFSLAEEGSHFQLGQVQNLSLSTGDFDAQLDAHWDKLKGATGYAVEISYDITSESAWKIVKSLGQTTRFALENLESRKKCWVRVSGSRGKESGAPSDPAVKTVP